MKFNGYSAPLEFSVYVANSDETYNNVKNLNELKENEAWGCFGRLTVIGETKKAWVYATGNPLFYERDKKGAIVAVNRGLERIKLKSLAKSILKPMDEGVFIVPHWANI